MEGIETQIGDKIRFDGYIAAPDGIRTFSTILDVDQGEVIFSKNSSSWRMLIHDL